MSKILFDEKSLPFILKALKIKTDIPMDKIIGIKDSKIYTNILDLLIDLQ